MKTEEQHLPKSIIKITIDCKSEELNEFKLEAFQKINQNIKIPGFRPGKIPENVLVEKLGKSSVQNEIAQVAIPKILQKVLNQKKITPIDYPKIEILTLNPLKFSAQIPILPEVKISEGWKKVKIKKNKIAVSKKEKDEAIENLRQKFASKIPVDRAAKNNDFIEITFFGKTIDGVEIEDMKSKRHPLILGKGNFIPGFEKNIIGMKKNEKKEFKIKFPANYPKKKYADKEFIFSVELLEIFESKLPEIDEKFSEKIFQKKLKKEDFEKEIEKILLAEIEKTEQNRRENELVSEWSKLAEIEIPEILIERELDGLLKNFRWNIENSGISWEEHLKNLKKTEADFRKDFYPRANDLAKQRLVLQKILTISEVDISDKEIAEKFNNQKIPEKTSREFEIAINQIKIGKLFDQFLKN